jgi:hypothetical protein
MLLFKSLTFLYTFPFSSFMLRTRSASYRSYGQARLGNSQGTLQGRPYGRKIRVTDGFRVNNGP